MVRNWGGTLIVVLLLTSVATAATEAEKQAAIDGGLAWLAASQQTNGRWEFGDDYYDTAATGSALLAFLEEGYREGQDVVINGTNYGDVIGDGLQYIFSKAQKVAISNQPAGDPDSNGNGFGVKFVLGGNNNRDTYVTGLVLPAIASTGTPNKIVGGTGQAAGMTYQQVVQDTVDYFAFGQEDSGNPRGGWRYYANSHSADNSTGQWPPMGMLFAQKMGVSAPAFVKDELAHWIEYIQNPNGGSGYDNPTNMVNESKTGSLLVEMALAGDDTSGVAYDLNHADTQAALDYLNANWRNTPSGTWYGNFGHPYAMWSIYKGLESTIGLNDTTWITNLNPQGTAQIDPGDTWNWYEDYSESLVQSQNANGSWSGYSYWTGPLATAWNINILNATRINIPAGIPEPTSFLVWSLLVLTTVCAGRRRR